MNVKRQDKEVSDNNLNYIVSDMPTAVDIPETKSSTNDLTVPKKHTTHGVLSNFQFMIKEQWIFEKKPVFIWNLRILSELVVSLLGIYFPKVVLDSIGHSIPSKDFLFRIGILTVILIIFRYASYFSEQSVIIGAIRILNMRFYIKKIGNPWTWIIA